MDILHWQTSEHGVTLRTTRPQTASGLGGYAGDTALLKLFQRQSRHPSTGGSCWPAAWSSHNAMHSGQRPSQPASSGKRFAQPSPTQIVNSSSTTLIRHHPTSTARALRYPQCGSRHQINGPATPSERPWSGDARGPAVHRRRQTHPFPWFPYHHGGPIQLCDDRPHWKVFS